MGFDGAGRSAFDDHFEVGGSKKFVHVGEGGNGAVELLGQNAGDSGVHIEEGNELGVADTSCGNLGGNFGADGAAAD